MHLLIIQIKKEFLIIALQKNYFGEVKILVPKLNEKNNLSKVKKILKKIKEYNIQNVVLNDELNKNVELKNTLFDNKKYIITGNRIAKVLLPKMIEEISNYMKYQKERLKVVLFLNEYSIENIDLIECIAKEVKQLTVISQNYTKYEKTANKLYQNFGCIIKLYNTDAKEFKREHIIINMDFKEEEMKNILIPRNSILISLNEKIESLKRSFNGIIINDIDIFGEGINNDNFRKLAVCEAKLYRPLRKIKDNERVFFDEKYVVNGYIGKNGKITQEEFEKIGKNFA